MANIEPLEMQRVSRILFASKVLSQYACLAPSLLTLRPRVHWLVSK